jgi:hypothetical protein
MTCPYFSDAHITRKSSSNWLTRYVIIFVGMEVIWDESCTWFAQPPIAPLGFGAAEKPRNLKRCRKWRGGGAPPLKKGNELRKLCC